MRSVHTDPELSELANRVLEHANDFGRVLPEMRFFILDGLEFTSLLEKHVYPTSPLNIWEGKRMVHRKNRIESGQESALYYEVVQTGNPSYAYLNDGNSAVTQASVMAHVVGHCEFSEINVFKDSTPDRTELVMHLVKKADLARQQMGTGDYLSFWNACESATSLIAANSQYNVERATQTETEISREFQLADESAAPDPTVIQPISNTITTLLKPTLSNDSFAGELSRRRRQETLSRKGYVLKAPCQDILGFLREYAPASAAERAVLDYMYITRVPQEFVMRTQIMNEGWAMYWEKKIMLELFKEKAVTGIVDYARVFSGVCAPRPYFQRNPYHLGYNLWCHIERLYKEGRVSLDYQEEVNLAKKENWNVAPATDPIEAMGHLVRTVTDYEFLRRFLTTELVQEFHLNRIDRRVAAQIGVQEDDIVQFDERWCWLRPEPVKQEMLRLYSHYFRPRIYLIDSDFLGGGLLLYHRDDGRQLKQEWILPTLKNLNRIWKGHTALVSKDRLYRFRDNQHQETQVTELPFDEIVERMRSNRKLYDGG